MGTFLGTVLVFLTEQEPMPLLVVRKELPLLGNVSLPFFFISRQRSRQYWQANCQLVFSFWSDILLRHPPAPAYSRRKRLWNSLWRQNSSSPELFIARRNLSRSRRIFPPRILPAAFRSTDLTLLSCIEQTELSMAHRPICRRVFWDFLKHLFHSLKNRSVTILIFF